MKARILAPGPNGDWMACVDEAAGALVAGRLVAFPTETVYGIGCNAYDPVAVERLRQVKGRPADKPFTLHIGRKDDAKRYAASIPLVAEKLIARYWPGPLTIVFPGNEGRGVGIRMPSNRIALALLRRTAVPVIAPSANRTGEPPATSAHEVAQALGDDLDLILDGGATTLQEASTVLRVADDGSWEILRRGSITEDMIRRTLGKTIVFVCTANSCRSPMAEVLCKQLLAEKLGCTPDQIAERGYSVLSAGTAAISDCPASRQAIEAMRRRGLDLTRHASRPITPGLVEDADLIFVMARHHADSILHIMPEAEDKVRMLDEQGYGDDIADPVGGSVEVFVACANHIERAIRAQLSAL